MGRKTGGGADIHCHNQLYQQTCKTRRISLLLYFDRLISIYICVSDFKKHERDILKELNCQMLSQQLLGKHLQIY